MVSTNFIYFSWFLQRDFVFYGIHCKKFVWFWFVFQRNPKAPDFKHKIDNTALWIDSKYTPTWVKDRLEDFNVERQGVYAFVNNFNLFFSRRFHIKKAGHVSFEMENSNIGISYSYCLKVHLEKDEGFDIFERRQEERGTSMCSKENKISQKKIQNPSH